MTITDFSNGFDTLLNSYATGAVFGSTSSIQDVTIDEYEKSFFLTAAQEEFVKNLYTGNTPQREGFEHTEELRRSLAFLIKEASLTPIETSDGKPLGLESNSKFFTLPEDLWFITYERILNSGESCPMKASQEVYPARQDEYSKLRKNPFRGANERRALRFDLSEGNVEIVSNYNTTSYYVRYLRKLQPIILATLDGDASINGKQSVTNCELPEFMHQQILELAVFKALQSKGIHLNNDSK